MQTLRFFGVAAVLTSCGGVDAQTDGAHGAHDVARVTSVEIAELEISPMGVDRFTSCPPAGELGQDWIPKLPPWSAPPVKQIPEGAPGWEPPTPTAPAPAADGRTATEKAIFDTYPDFRRCYQRGLLHDPTQDGHAAIVLRIGSDGRVAAVESYGVCELSSEVIGCMKAAAGKLRFEPPSGGSETITIPAVFTTRGGRPHEHPSPNDAYTASAYVAIEAARPDLHACDTTARRSGQELQATATMLLDIDATGHVQHTHVDPWTGNQAMLGCAADALNRVVFEKPPAGRGTVLARISFNPRAGTK